MRHEPPAINFHLQETPPREPQGGGERTECAALFCINTSGNRFSARHRCPAMPLKDHDAREHIAARAEAGPQHLLPPS